MAIEKGESSKSKNTVNVVDKGESDDVVICTICLENVEAGSNRTSVKLHCTHLFHLDCIGSFFNFKHKMECPNCRQVEIGKWVCGKDCDPNEDGDDRIGNILEGATQDVDITMTPMTSVWDTIQGILQTQPSSDHSPVPPVGLPATDLPGSNAPLLFSHENGDFHMHANAMENHVLDYPMFYRTLMTIQQISSRMARGPGNNGRTGERTGESIWAEPAFPASQSGWGEPAFPASQSGWGEPAFSASQSGLGEPPFSADEDHDGPGEPSE